MKGIILAGGLGTRLYPLTKATSKELLPIYDKPMIFYPLELLLKAGIKDILFIVSPIHAGDFLQLLRSGEAFGAKFTYEIQDKPLGVAQAFILGESFIGKDSVALILGDNIFDYDFTKHVLDFKSGGHIFAKEVSDPERFGVVKIDEHNTAVKIVEKPKEFLSNLAITGFYLYDNRVAEIAKSLTPSSRNELEITDIHNWYLRNNELIVDTISGDWIDAGTFDSLHEANVWAFNKAKKAQ